MPIKRGHIAPHNTYIVTLIRNFDSQYENFIVANATLPSRPIIYCSDGFCELLRYTKGQLMLKSSALSIFYGPETTVDSMETLLAALNQTNETEVLMNLYSRDNCVMCFRIVVTPVRDETGGLPLYLLFFREEVSNTQTLLQMNKGPGLRTKWQLKSFRVNKSPNHMPKNPIRTNIPKSTKSSVLDVRKNFRDKKCDTSDSKLGTVGEGTTITESLAHPQSLSSSDQIHFIEDYPNESVSGQSKECRPTSLFLPKNQDDSLKRESLSKIDVSESQHGTPKCSDKSKRRPSTWYRGYTEDESSEIIHGSSRKSRHLHPTTEESEALQLVLSSHAEPPKSSVTEKFAQFLSMDEDLHVEHRFQSPRMHKFTLKHYSVFKAVWDWIILALIIYTAIFTPYVTVFLMNTGNKYAKLISPRNITTTTPLTAITFDINRTQNESSASNHSESSDILHTVHPSITTSSSSPTLLSTVDILVDVMFIIDILINFRTTYVNKNDEVVSHPKRIAAHYIKGWFIIDLVAAIPFDLLFFRTAGDQGTFFNVSNLLVYPSIDIQKSLMYASIFGNVGALIQRLYSGTARYHAQMLRIKEFIRFHQIPSPLRQRLEEYSTQVWEHTNGIDMTMVQYSFPESLQSDICLYVYRHFLSGSAAFKSLNDGCLRNISLRIRSSHMPPSDTLVHTGDLLTAMYYVVKGSLEVVTTDDIILGVLNPGDFFGGLPPLASVQKNPYTVQMNSGWDYWSENHLNPMNTNAKYMQMDDYSSMPNTTGTTTNYNNTNNHNHNSNSVIYQPNPPPKSRFAVRALTYADVQFIDRHDLAELCSIYPELSLRLLERFELTLPLTISSDTKPTNITNTDRCSTIPNVESFLDATSSWHIVCSLLTGSLTSPGLSKRPSDYSKFCMLNETSYKNRCFDNPFIGKPSWELERYQRLFDHGALSFHLTSYSNAQIPVCFIDTLYNNNDNTNNNTSGVTAPSTHQHNPVTRKSESFTMCSTHSSEQNHSLPITPVTNTQTLHERRMRMRLARNLPNRQHQQVPPPTIPSVLMPPTSSSCSSVSNLPVKSPDKNRMIHSSVIYQPTTLRDLKNLNEEKEIIDLLVKRFASVEKQIENLDVRISQSVTTILQQLEMKITKHRSIPM
ncbi:unnamed protein product [Schistosoma margrebowiei]|uniref:Cyclic nucleotide-binding domain-containing protein n=1 Tax=Schistosoma margrebowiei TaxID=48269 RepID=A0AA85AA71_9TREM|nr:unnamed protein product [Schistosoma margrebowiei]